jgi:hypothetical protein
MKTILITFSVLFLTAFTTTEGPLTKSERAAAVSELNHTKNRVNITVKGLSSAQLNFKSSPDAWSIAECLEHIAISEENIFGLLVGSLQSPADPSKRAEVKMTDQQLLDIIRSRDRKVQTREAFKPTGKYGSYQTTLDAFLNKRHDNTGYVENTQDDLRNRYATLPFGTVDAYQVILFMSGHTERHVRQMEEVKQHADFPRQ